MISDKSIYNNVFRDIKYLYIAYIVVCLILYCLSPSKLPSSSNLIAQSIFSISLFFILYFIRELNPISITKLFFIYNICLTIFLRILFLNVYDNPWGAYPNDAYAYNEVGLYGVDHSFKDFFNGIPYISQAVTMGDYGFSVWLKLIYSLGWNEVSSQTVLIIVNSILVTLVIYVGYKLGLRLFNKNYAKIFVLFLTSLQYLIYNSVGGYKESLFFLILVTSAYYMQRSIQEKSLKTTGLFLLSTGSIFFFREIICIIYFIAYGIGYFFSFKKNRPFVKIIVIIIGVLGSLGIGVFLKATGLSSLEQVASVSEGRLGDNSGTIGMTIGVIASFIGPFPNIVGQDPDRPEYIYNFMYFIKLYFSFYFLIGIYLIVKKKVWQFTTQISIVAMTIIMCTMAAVSLDIRYQLTMLVQYFLITTYGINNQAEIKSVTLYRIPYITMILGLTYMYNIR